jgi:hypothetical protein
MRGQEFSNLIAFVPRGTVNIEVDLPSFDAVAQVLQECNEPFAVAFWPAEEAVPTIERIDPAEEV